MDYQNKVWPLFSLFYSNEASGSELVFGGTESSHYTGQIHWIPLSSATYYQINIDRYKKTKQNRLITKHKTSKMPRLTVIPPFLFLLIASRSMEIPRPALVAARPSSTLVPPWLLAQPVTFPTLTPGLEPQPMNIERWAIPSHHTIHSKLSPLSERRVSRKSMLWRQNSERKIIKQDLVTCCSCEPVKYQ